MSGDQAKDSIAAGGDRTEPGRAEDLSHDLLEQVERADHLLRTGHVADAQEVYAGIVRASEAAPGEVEHSIAVRLGRAWALYRLGRHDEAIEDARRAVKLDPASGEAHRVVGMLLMATQELERALPALDRAIELNDSDATAYFLRGMVHGFESRWKEAESDLTTAIELNPTAEAYLRRGMLSGRPASLAIPDLDRAIELDPANAEAYGYRAAFHYDAHDFGRALDDFNRAIALGQETAQAYGDRADAYLALERFDEALRDLDHALSIEPSAAYLHMSRARVHVREQDLVGARSDLDKALELEPDNVDALTLRGMVNEVLGPFDAALTDYDHVIQLGVETADAYRNRGDARLKLEQYEDAIHDYDKAIVRDGTLAGAYVGRGHARNRLMRYEPAIFDFESAIDLSPDDSVAYVGRAEALIGMGAVADAIDNYRNALARDQSNREAHVGLVTNLIRLGDEATDPLLQAQRPVWWRQALEASDRALDAFSEDPSILGLRALALVRLEAYDHAAAVCARAIASLGQEEEWTRAFLEHMCAEALRLWGEQLLDRDRLNESLGSYQRSFALWDAYPNADVLIGWGEAYVALDRLDQGRAKFEAAVAADADHAWAHIAMGRCIYLQGEHEGSQTAFDAAQHTKEASGDDRAYALIGLGLARSKQGAVDESAAAFEQALLGDHGAQALNTRASRFHYYREWELEREDLVAALEHDPSLPKTLNALGYYHFLHSDEHEVLREALKLVERAIELERDGPNLSIYLGTAGEVYLKLGEPGEAARRLKAAIEIAPLRLDIRERLRQAEQALHTAVATSARTLGG